MAFLDDLARRRTATSTGVRPQRRAAKPRESGGGGFFADLANTIGDPLNDIAPELGLGNVAKMGIGLVPGIAHLATDWATKGLGEGDWSTYSQFGEGVGKSFLNTAATATKTFGGDFWLEPLAEEVTGYRPKDIWQRMRDNETGLLPAVIEDVGNVALLGGAASKALKAGDVGKLANEARLAREVSTAGSAPRLLKGYQKAQKAAEGVRTSGRPLPAPEAIAGRQTAIQRAQTAAHPYEAAMKRFVRPTAGAATQRTLATAAAEGDVVDATRTTLTQAERVVAEAQAGRTTSVTEAQAIQHLRETKQAITDEAVAASKQTLESLAATTRPANDASLDLYQQAQPDLSLPQRQAVVHRGEYPADDMARLADEYDAPAFHNPADPEVRAAYLGDEATGRVGFLEQVKRQYLQLTRATEEGGLGVDVQFHGPDEPEYASYGEMAADLSQNRRMRVRDTAAFGDTPNEFMAQVDPDTGLTYNDMFRATHDAFGHAKANDFGRAGELTAYREHANWFTEDAQPALASETVGQTASLIRSGDGSFPPQKAGRFSPDTINRLRFGAETAAESVPDLGRPMVAGRRGIIEPTDPAVSPQAEAVTRMRLSEVPGWSKALVDRLPMPVVRGLAKVDNFLARRDVSTVAREMGRIVEVSRRAAITDPAVQIAVNEVAGPLVGKTLPDGTVLNRQSASELVGAELMTRLDSVEMLEQLGDEVDPILKQAVDDVHSPGGRIPKKLIEELGLEDALQRSAEEFRRLADERVSTLIGGRLGTKGLEGIAEDDPIMTARQVRAWKQVKRLIADKTKLEGRLDGELARLTNEAARIQTTIDKVIAAADADEVAAQAAGQRATRLYEQHPFGDDAALRDRALAEVADATVNEGGATLDTVSGDLITDAPYVVTVRPDTLRQVTLDDFAARGPEILGEVLDANPLFRDPRIRLGTWKHALEEDTMIDGQFVPEGTEVVDIDPSIDQWVADPKNPRSPWRRLARQEAVIIGRALGQDSIWDGAAGDVIWTQVDPAVQNLNSQFVDLVLNPRSKFAAHAQRTMNAVRDQMAARSRDTEGWGPHLPPKLTMPDVDAILQGDMVLAHAWAKATGKVDEAGAPTKAALDEFFDTKRIQFSPAKAPRVKMERGLVEGASEGLAQVMLKLDLDDPSLVQKMIDATPDAENRVRWYNNSHDAVEKLARGREIVLGDGTRVDAADLMYQLIAVTSFQADPLTNLGNALNAVGNWRALQSGTTKMRDTYLRNMEKFLSLPEESRTNQALIDTLLTGIDPAKRTVAPLPQKLSSGAGMYGQKGNHIKALVSILSGHTMDKWTPETILDFNIPWGGATKSKKGGWQRMLDDVPEGTWERARAEALSPEEVPNRALALHYGDQAWGKITSFWQNLANPEASRAVTLDTWMARAFSVRDWAAPGAYAEYSAKLDTMATQFGIQPHQLQALIWTYAKNEITRQAAARVWGNVSRATEILGNGGRLGAADDPVIAMFDWELGRNADYDAEAAAWQAADPATRGPKPTKFKVEETPDTGALYARKTGAADLKQVTDSRDNYLAAVEAANSLAEAGDVAGAQQRIATWAQGYHKSTEAAERAADFSDFIGAPNARIKRAMNRAGLDDLGEVFDGLADKIQGEVLGSTILGGRTRRSLVKLYSGADFTTLFHENLHALRQIMAPEDVAIIERAIRKPGAFAKELGDEAGGATRRAAEELFVEEFMGYLVSGRAKRAGLEPVMERLRDALRDGRKIMSQRGHLQVEAPEDMMAVWDKYLDPALPADRTPSVLDEMGESAARTAPEGVTPEQLAGRNTLRSGESAADALRRQRRMDKSIAQKQFLERRRVDRLRRVGRLQKAKAEFDEVLRSGATPLQAQIDKLGSRANRLSGRLAKELEDPKTSQVPPVWQPLKQVMDELWQRAADDATLAAHMEGMPRTFGEILRLAAEKGFDPTHIRSFTPNQVQKLVYDTVSLGIPGRNVGEEIVAGTRKPRVSGIPRTQSLEALVGAVVEATHEVQTNELVSFIEGGGIAKPVVNGVVPDGWEAWDPVKRWFVNREETLPSGKATQFGPKPTMMIPKTVGSVLRGMNKSYNHWTFRALGKPSSWWRTFILTLSPRWYVNNFIGNFALATAEGVRMRDWKAAWASYRQRGPEAGALQLGERQAPAFADVPGVTGASIYTELEAPTFVPPSVDRTARLGTQNVRGLLKDVRKQPSREKWVQVKNRLARANEVVDELARSAVYHRTVRVTGRPEVAVQRAYKALVDYGDLAPIERSLVRAVIPFYAWQKGILKAVARMGYDNPAAFSLMQRVSDMNREMLEDQYGTELPEGYQGILDVPGVGIINTRGWNPFADAGSLVRANGIAESANPIVEAIVRNELNAPETTRPEDYRINAFGRLVAETNPAATIAESFTSGLPQGQLALTLAGESPYPNAPSAGVAASRFAGVNRMTPEDIARIVKRTREARALIAARGEQGSTVPPVRRAVQRFSGRDFQPYL